MNARVVAYAGANPVRYVYEPLGPAMVPINGAPAVLKDLRRIEFYAGSLSPTLVIEPYFGKPGVFDSVLEIVAGSIRMRLWWLLRFARDADGHPLLATIGRTNENASTIVSAASLANCDALAGALGLTRGLGAEWTGEPCAVRRPAGGVLRRLAPACVGADAFQRGSLSNAEWQSVDNYELTQVQPLARSIFNEDGSKALLLGVQALSPLPIPAPFSAGIFDRFDRVRTLTSPTLTQLQSSDVLGYRETRLGLASEWIEFECAPDAAEIAAQTVVAPLSLALNALRGSSGLSCLTALQHTATRLRWRCRPKRRLTLIDTVADGEFECEPGFALRQPYLGNDERLEPGEFRLIRTHAGTPLSYLGRIADPNENFAPNDLLEASSQVALRDLASDRDFGAESPTLHLAIEALALTKQSVRIGSLDVRLGLSLPDDKGALAIARLDISGYRIGALSDRALALRSGKVALFNWPVLALTPGTSDPLPGQDQAGAAVEDPVLLFPTAPTADDRIIALLQVRELWEQGKDRSFELSLTPFGASSAPATPMVVIDPLRFFVAELPKAELLGGKSGRVDGELAYYSESSEGPRWRVVWDDGKLARRLRLPPQVLGETMEKGGTPPSLPPGELADFRLSPPADLELSVGANQNLQDALWNWRQVFGYPGQRSPGAGVVSTRFELLYGLEANIDGSATPSTVRWVETFARRGDFSPAIDVALVEGGAIRDPRRVARQRRATRWAATRSALARRPAALELGIDGARPAVGETMPRAVLERGVSFALRSSADLAYPVVPRPPGSAAPNGQLKGGFAWAFESRAVYEEVWSRPTSTSGSLAEPVLTALGGYGEFKAGFANDKSIIRGRTSLGRSEIVAIERIGRIAVYWHRAKHVIVYERSTLPSEQMRCEQPRHGGRPLLRKVDEYIEILQPERRYPEDRNADRRSVGMLQGVRFKSTRIKVLSRWGQEDAQGVLIPLWNRNSDPRIYPKPAIDALLAGQAAADRPEVSAAFAEPEFLYFFSATDPALGADTDAWPAFPEIDYVDRPEPVPDALPPLGEDGDQSLPDATLVPPGFERVTHRIDAGEAANLLAERGGENLGAQLQALTLMRGRARPVIGTLPEAFATLGATTELMQQARALADQVARLAAAGIPAGLTALSSQKAGLITAAQGAIDRANRARAELKRIAALPGAQSLCAPLKRQCMTYLDRQRLVLRQQIASRIDAVFAVFDGQANIALPAAIAEVRQAIEQLKLQRQAQLQEPLDRAVGNGLESVESMLGQAVGALGQLRAPIKTTYDEGAASIRAAIGNNALLAARIRDFQAVLDQRLTALVEALPNPPPLAHRAIAAIREASVVVGRLVDRLEATLPAAEIEQILADGERQLFGPKGLFESAAAAASRVRDIGIGWLSAAAAPGFALSDWSRDALSQIEREVNSVAEDGVVQLARLRDALDAATSSLLSAIDAAFAAGAADLSNRIEQLCKDFAQLVAPDLVTAADTWLGGALANAKAQIEALRLDGPIADLEQLAKRTERWLKDQMQGLRQLGDGAEHFLKRLGSAPSFADPDGTLRLIRAVGAGPLLPQMRFNRERIAYFFDDTRNAIKTSPMAALINRVGSDLKAFGLRLPTDELADQLIPKGLKGIDLDRILPDFAGVRDVFKAVKLPDILPEDMVVKHGFDKESQSAWLDASIDIELADAGEVFKISPLRLLLLQKARFQARSQLRVGLDGNLQKSVSASITADWQLEISGQALVTFRKTALRLDDGRLRFELKPGNIELNQLIAWMGDAVRAFGSEDDGLRLELVTDGGRPVGLRALLDLPIPASGAGAVSIVGLALGARFELRVHPNFTIGIGLNLARESMPFAIFIAFLGGGGWLEADVDYEPGSGALTSTVSLGISAGAGAALNLGPMRGSVVLLLSVRGSYRTGAGGGLTLALSLLLRGHATVWGWLHIDVAVMLALTYRSDRSLVGTGTISVTVRISRFFKVRFRTSVSYTFAKGSGAKSLSKSEAQAKLARAA